MTDEKPSFASCFTLSNLMQASRECESGVRWKRQTQQFANKRLTYCADLLRDIEQGKYTPKKVSPFTVNERGKTRIVKPVTFRDRVAQRCFCDHVLVSAVEGFVTKECSAVLPGRGLSYAFERVKAHAQRCPSDGWVLKYDFSDYFASIDQDALLLMLRAILPDDGLYRFAETVIRADGPGLDLGSHVSQLAAAMYPTLIDQAVEDLDGVTGSHRYMDDGIVFCRSKEAAKAALETVRGWSETLGLVMNERKTFFNRVTHPFVFCKMRFTRDENGNVRMEVRKQQSRRSVRHAKSVARLAARKPELGIDLEPVRASLSGYLARGDEDLSWLVDGAFEA